MRVARPENRTQENPQAIGVGSRRWKQGVTSAFFSKII